MDLVRLRNTLPVAKGSIRDVYRHPADDRLLIKIIRESTREEKYGSGQPWYKFKRRRYRHYISYLREFREHLAAKAKGTDHPSCLQNVVGLAETDVGLGLIVEAAVDRQGRYAPTLTEIVKSGRFEGEVRAHFERFLREVIDSDVILADLHLNNVVFAYKPVIGDHFVIIDGIGFKTVIPLERMSPAINRIANRQKVAHFRRRVETLASEVADGASAASAAKPEHSRKLEPILSAPLLAALIAAAGLALALTTGEAALLP